MRWLRTPGLRKRRRGRRRQARKAETGEVQAQPMPDTRYALLISGFISGLQTMEANNFMILMKSSFSKRETKERRGDGGGVALEEKSCRRFGVLCYLLPVEKCWPQYA